MVVELGAVMVVVLGIGRDYGSGVAMSKVVAVGADAVHDSGDGGGGGSGGGGDGGVFL